MVGREGEMDQQQKPGEVRGIIGNGGLGLPYKQTLPAVRMSTYILTYIIENLPKGYANVHFSTSDTPLSATIPSQLQNRLPEARIGFSTPCGGSFSTKGPRRVAGGDGFCNPHSRAVI